MLVGTSQEFALGDSKQVLRARETAASALHVTTEDVKSLLYINSNL